MLSRIQTSIALTLFASFSLIAGCIITDGNGNPDDDDDETTTTGTHTTTSGGGEGGEGGAGVGGTGGTGGTGGSGGSEECVGTEGTGLDEKSCNNMNITPKSGGGAASSSCGEMFDQDPPGYGVCLHGFKIFSDGPSEHLQQCLSQITVEPANACDQAKVQACVDGMYKATCEVKAITDFCVETGMVCGEDPFNVAECAYQLKPFNDDAMQAFTTCFNADASIPCQEAHDKCYGEALSF